jgi:hypothetical protein
MLFWAAIRRVDPAAVEQHHRLGADAGDEAVGAYPAHPDDQRGGGNGWRLALVVTASYHSPPPHAEHPSEG